MIAIIIARTEISTLDIVVVPPITDIVPNYDTHYLYDSHCATDDDLYYPFNGCPTNESRLAINHSCCAANNNNPLNDYCCITNKLMCYLPQR